MKFIVALLLLSSFAYSNASSAGLSTTGAVVALARKMIELSKTEDVEDMEMVPYHCSLAASYGQLNNETIKNMDRNLLIAIAGINKRIQTVRENMGNRIITFKDYVSLMNQNVLLIPDNSTEIFREKYLGYSDYRLATSDKQEGIVEEVSDWFANELIDDPDVLADTKIEILDYANIVASTGAKIKGFRSVLLRNHYVERSVVDMGVLRYPDLNKPYFKLFRIQLFAYRKSKAVLFMQKDESGIRGQYQSMIFVPNESIIAKLQQSTKTRATNEALKMFNE
ncbi:uncharacterized protein LOC106875293 [Octopus bimaculoides]|uniref:Uncharacterized protein n=1 Tax=Octopus bimaculoides TaxID=37653 RepID=A0A0L8GQM4_OCTBM|nr:uncharacterized protein LOC106875293 [Octopus bimaculoides]|eukprot:XP_014778869.1 PREDICTED: uncharacterized protein LOC106875293 [Octopus bimaculoides]